MSCQPATCSDHVPIIFLVGDANRQVRTEIAVESFLQQGSLLPKAQKGSHADPTRIRLSGCSRIRVEARCAANHTVIISAASRWAAQQVARRIIPFCSETKPRIIILHRCPRSCGSEPMLGVALPFQLSMTNADEFVGDWDGSLAHAVTIERMDTSYPCCSRIRVFFQNMHHPRHQREMLVLVATVPESGQVASTG